jgi:hypothetical protein
LGRKSIGIDIDKENVACMKRRMAEISKADTVMRFYKDYVHTDNLSGIWPVNSIPIISARAKMPSLF